MIPLRAGGLRHAGRLICGMADEQQVPNRLLCPTFIPTQIVVGVLKAFPDILHFVICHRDAELLGLKIQEIVQCGACIDLSDDAFGLLLTEPAEKFQEYRYRPFLAGRGIGLFDEKRLLEQSPLRAILVDILLGNLGLSHPPHDDIAILGKTGDRARQREGDRQTH